jgi:alkylation response protein AidB-like acyl-CoA dehydrogenase
MPSDHVPAGGAFLLQPCDISACFTPEDLGEQERMIKKTAADFLANEVLPCMAAIEAKDGELIRSLLFKAGDLGLLGADVPQEYGGLALPKIASLVISEALGEGASFTVTWGAQTSIGTLPIVYFGDKAQKEKYLPRLTTGRLMGAYCLTEAGAGSDAIGGCRTKAVLSPDGKHYLLSGEKLFVTNGGWADVFIVFAKIDGRDFSAFIVEKTFPGVSAGPEEKKLGIKGSSTTSLVLQNAKVPAENLLYAPGKGHHIALNVLNMGRYKLACACLGAAKAVLRIAALYATTREQFSRPICDFGAVSEKLGRMAQRLYAAESVVYRTVGLLDAALSGVDPGAADYTDKANAAIREYAVEFSINKVLATEMLDYLADECLQIHGGYGYICEYPAERIYRDARINRIYEGTSEINRLTIPAELLKKAMTGKLPLMAAGKRLLGEIMDYMPSQVELGEEPLSYQAHLAEMAKKAVIFVAGAAAQKFLQRLPEEQEVLLRAADMIIETFAMESAVVRAQKALAAGAGEKTARLHLALASAYVDEALPKIQAWAVQALSHIEEGDSLRAMLMGLRKLLKYQPMNAIALNREIARAVAESGGYPLG